MVKSVLKALVLTSCLDKHLLLLQKVAPLSFCCTPAVSNLIDARKDFFNMENLSHAWGYMDQPHHSAFYTGSKWSQFLNCFRITSLASIYVFLIYLKLNGLQITQEIDSSVQYGSHTSMRGTLHRHDNLSCAIAWKCWSSYYILSIHWLYELVDKQRICYIQCGKIHWVLLHLFNE